MEEPVIVNHGPIVSSEDILSDSAADHRVGFDVWLVRKAITPTHAKLHILRRRWCAQLAISSNASSFQSLLLCKTGAADNAAAQNDKQTSSARTSLRAGAHRSRG